MDRLRKLPPHLHGQSGATLVIALIILLVMSMIGVSNMQSSTLQERMAANTKQKTTARIAAESALNTAEKWLDNNLNSSADLALFNGTLGLYSAVATRYNNAAPIWTGSEAIADVTLAENWASRGHNPAVDIVSTGLVANQPKYVIEFLGRDTGTAARNVNDYDADGSARRGAGDFSPYIFRIIAIGWAKDSNIYTVLESTYRTGYGPGNFSYF